MTEVFEQIGQGSLPLQVIPGLLLITISIGMGVLILSIIDDAKKSDLPWPLAILFSLCIFVFSLMFNWAGWYVITGGNLN